MASNFIPILEFYGFHINNWQNLPIFEKLDIMNEMLDIMNEVLDIIDKMLDIINEMLDIMN